MKKKGFTLIELIVVLCMVFVIGCILVPGIIKVCNQQVKTITVTGKESHRHGDSNDKYLVYTTDTTYEITDSLLKWRWDSSDLYGKIEEGKTYRVETGGYRIPLFSMYENIYTATPVE